MADKRISQLIERTDIANNDVLPIVASGATTTNKVTVSTLQDWMQDNLDVGVTSVGLSVPSAFSVSGSPVTTSGNITISGAGTTAQYIRGDGSLADFPSISGGGSSVSYYLNGSVSQGTIGGVAYLEMNKVPILGTGTDFTINADGYIASFITDAGDPSLLEIPGGNWNFETYLQASSGGGTPSFYIELYKVNSGGTATLIASNSGTPELIAFGTTINPYFSALAVPTTTLALTDRLAIRYYVNHSGRTITLHTENNTLCQIITTFTTGLTALNGLTAQVQNFATGTSGTDFNISSASTTHTFNLPDASASNRGAVTTGSQVFGGVKTFANGLSLSAVGGSNQVTRLVNIGTLHEGSATLNQIGFNSGNNIYFGKGLSNGGVLQWTNAAVRYYTLPDADGTLALTSNLSAYLPLSGGTLTGALNGVNASFTSTISSQDRIQTDTIFSVKHNSTIFTLNGYNSIQGNLNSFAVYNGTKGMRINFPSDESYTYSLPDASGTFALTSNLSSYLPLAGGTLTGALNGTSAVFSGDLQSTTRLIAAASSQSIILTPNSGGTTNRVESVGTLPLALVSGAAITMAAGGTTPQITLATTGAVTLTGALNGTSASFGGTGTGNNVISISNNDQSNARLRITNTGSGGRIYSIVGGLNGANNSSFSIYDETAGSTRFEINSTGAATFSSSVTATANASGRSGLFGGASFGLRIDNSGSFNNGGSTIHGVDNTFVASYQKLSLNGSSLEFMTDYGTKLTIANSGAATFSSSVTATTGLTVGSLGSGSNAIITLANNASGSPRTIYYKASDATINFTGTGGTDQVTITNGGNVGIGTASPLQTLTLAGTQMMYNTAGDGNANTVIGSITSQVRNYGTGIATSSFASIQFATDPTSWFKGDIRFLTNGSDGTSSGGSERMRITSSGHLQLNTDSTNVSLLRTNSSNSVLVLTANSSLADNTPRIEIIGTGYSSPTDTIFYRGATQIFTSSSASSERMRITSGGSVLIGHTSATYSEKALIQYAGTGNQGFHINQTGSTAANDKILFSNGNGIVGYIRTDGSATSYVTASDYRLKEDLQEINGLEKVSALKVYDFKWLNSEDRTDGVIAHELAEVLPYAVSGEKDGEMMQGVDYSKIVPVLIKAIQELKAEIDSLKTK